MTFSNIVRFDVIDSTNRFVVDEAAAGAPEGLVAVADEQSAGRGRLGRSWIANRGQALLCSLLFRPLFEASEYAVVPVLVALAAADAAGTLANAMIGCKWPNDLVYSDRKLGGLLSEYVAGTAEQGASVVVGVGMNLVWSETDAVRLGADGFAIEPVGLAEIAAHAVGRDELLVALLGNVDERYSKITSRAMREATMREYSVRCSTVGRLVSVTTPSANFVGRAIEVAKDGRLVVDVDGTVVRLDAADVVHLRED